MANKFFTSIRARFFSTAADNAVDIGVNNDTHPRISIDAGGKVSWGSGSAAVDVALYRDSADVLKTDDKLVSVCLDVIGEATQLDNIQQWLDPSSNLLAYMTPSGGFYAATKSFDIVHPSNPDMRLRYGSVEAPEHSVQVRGRSRSSLIQLPDYWKDLVNDATVTVQLTPMGRKQNLFVKTFSNSEITIGGSRKKDYFYTVSAERKDVPKLVVEYGS